MKLPHDGEVPVVLGDGNQQRIREVGTEFRLCLAKGLEYRMRPIIVWRIGAEFVNQRLPGRIGMRRRHPAHAAVLNDIDDAGVGQERNDETRQVL